MTESKKACLGKPPESWAATDSTQRDSNHLCQLCPQAFQRVREVSANEVTDMGKHSPHQLCSNREPSSKGVLLHGHPVCSLTATSGGARSSLQATRLGLTHHLPAFSPNIPQEQIWGGADKGSLPHLGPGSWQVWETWEQEGAFVPYSVFPKLFAFSLPGACSTILPQMQRKQERKTESQRLVRQTEWIPTHPGLVQSQAWDHPSRDPKHLPLGQEGEIKRSSAFP